MLKELNLISAPRDEPWLSMPPKRILSTSTSDWLEDGHVTQFWPMRCSGKTAGGREALVNDCTP